jgi:hypothetical protein
MRMAFSKLIFHPSILLREGELFVGNIPYAESQIFEKSSEKKNAKKVSISVVWPSNGNKPCKELT